jgi:hypothetical protein
VGIKQSQINVRDFFYLVTFINLCRAVLMKPSGRPSGSDVANFLCAIEDRTGGIRVSVHLKGAEPPAGPEESRSSLPSMASLNDL